MSTVEHSEYVMVDPRNTQGKPQLICLYKDNNLLLPGAKIPQGMTPVEAAKACLQKVTSYVPDSDIMDEVGCYYVEDRLVRVFTCPVQNLIHPSNQNPATPTYWFDWDKVKINEDLYPALRILIPLIRECPPGWKVTKQEEGWHFDYDPKRSLRTEEG